jgi:S1-C subfamily serine protease
LGSSLNAVEGQRVLVIGNPEGLEGTVSDGIISAFRSGRSMIQITALISPGSSGSPVLDETGQVIGMATLVSKEGQSLNFAISAEAIKDAIQSSAPPSVANATPTATGPPQTVKKAFYYYLKASSESNEKNYKDAADYTEAIRLNSDDAEAYYSRGYTYHVLGDEKAASSDLKKAKKLGSHNN